MLLYLAKKLALLESAFRIFNYLTLRAILAALTALVISFLIGPWMIRKLSQNLVGQRVRDDGPKSHLPKAGTPTMGGALILSAICLSTLLWADLANRFVDRVGHPEQIHVVRRNVTAGKQTVLDKATPELPVPPASLVYHDDGENVGLPRLH